MLYLNSKQQKRVLKGVLALVTKKLADFVKTMNGKRVINVKCGTRGDDNVF